MSWFLLFLGICPLLWGLQKTRDKMKGRPPGPFRFPIIGCLPQVLLTDLAFPFIAFEKLSKYYGKIFYVQIGLAEGVAVNGYDSLMEVYRNDDLIGRFDDKFFLDHTFGKPLGLLSAQVDIWRETRHFSCRVLREFGFGVKRKMEGLIQAELADFSENILHKSENNDGIIHVDKLFNAAALNVTWSMVAGTHYSYDDPKLIEIVTLLDDFATARSFGAGLLSSFPFLLDWAPKVVGFDLLAKANKGMQKYLKEILIETRSQGDYRTNPSNFIEIYLQKVDSRESTGNIDDVVYSDENLISILYDLLLAGTDTSSNTLASGILHMVLNQDIQEKVWSEIDAVIGSHRSPGLSDKEKMPFTEATILEILRTANTLPIMPRKLDKDATVGKYRLPKGTMVYLNLYSASMDKDFWGDPEVFRPERFLSSEGKTVNADRIIPFGAGKRNCLGESVARATIFIMFTGMIQKFKLDINPAEGSPTRRPVLGITLSPAPFTTMVTPRY